MTAFEFKRLNRSKKMLTEPTNQLSIYTAGRIAEGPKFLDLAAKWPEFTFTSSWIRGAENDMVECYMKAVWDMDYREVQQSDVVLIHKFREGAGAFRGALVEVGMGLAFGKQIVVVGDWPEYGSWQFHGNCHRVPSLLVAREVLVLIAKSLHRGY